MRKVTVRGLPKDAGPSIWRDASHVTVMAEGKGGGGLYAVDVRTGQARQVVRLSRDAWNAILPGAAGGEWRWPAAMGARAAQYAAFDIT